MSTIAEQIRERIDATVILYGHALTYEQVMTAVDGALGAVFAEEPTDFSVFEDDDSGPSATIVGPELEEGIFNFAVHLVRHYAMTMTPAQARARVASWLEDVAKGLRDFSTTEENNVS